MIMYKINKVSRITALGIGLTAAFFASCKKVNAVSITFSETLVVNPVNGSVFEIPKNFNNVMVNASLNGSLGIALTWDDKDLAGNYTITAKGILRHNTKTWESALQVLQFAKNVNGGAISNFLPCNKCVPAEGIQDLFGIGNYATSYDLSVVFTAVPQNSPSGTGNSIAKTTNWSVKPTPTPTPVPWETDAISLVVTTGFFLGGVAIKGKLAKKNLESISEEPKI